MRYLIISDLHSNMESLEAALEYKDYDRVAVLGDLVGYAANPNEVVERVQGLSPAGIIRGNHDKVVSGIEDGEFFVGHAHAAAMWTRRNMNAPNLAYLRSLPEGPLEVAPPFSIAHGAPLDEEEYIIYPEDSEMQFAGFPTPICFIGHSHLPLIFSLNEQQDLRYDFPKHGERYTLDLSGRQKYLINPGSTGQPRDGDPRGSFAVLDIDQATVEFIRYEYPLEKTQRKILDAGLPPFLAHRLAKGR